MTTTRTICVLAATGLLVVSACGGDDATSTAGGTDVSTTSAVGDGAPAVARDGVWLVPPTAAAATIADPPAGLVVLDVRTPEEFEEGHIDGAVLLDFYRDDFAARLAELDPDVPYVLYCRSGNRSGQAATLMEELGFASVEEVDGGIVEWQIAGLPVVTDG